MKIAKTLLGFVIWIVLGFLLYCLCAGIGMIAYFILSQFPWYHAVLGTVAGCVIVYLHLTDDKGKKG